MKSKDKIIQIIPSKDKAEKRVTILFENDLSLSTIENIIEKVKEAFTNYNFLDINLRNVNNMDLSYIQLFYSIKATAKKLNKIVSFDAQISDELRLLYNNSDMNKVLF